jgi:lipid II:glycine glycyltransferase (peptidoglycan interpeptide bridge formation enzyme)
MHVNGTAVLALKRKIPLTNKFFIYLPRAFDKNSFDNEILSKSLAILKTLSPTHIVIEPNLSDKSFSAIFKNNGLKESGETNQPMHTNIIGLKDGEENVWTSMTSTYRRNIRKSIKYGCKVEVHSSKNHALEAFWEIMTDVKTRTGYVAHNFEYFKKVWRIMSSAGKAKIFLCKHDSTNVGAYLCIYSGPWSGPWSSPWSGPQSGKNVYELYGGINDEGKKLRAGYLLKWESIKEAIKTGYKYYDQWGSAPKINDEFDSSHPLAGVAKFKQGFGGKQVEFLPQYTLVLSNRYYMFYNLMLLVNKTIIKMKKLT